MTSNEIKWFYEQSAMRADKANKRLVIIIILLISLFFISNGAWLYYASQFSVEETTMIDAEQDGDLNIIGGGNVNYGQTESNNNQD